MCDPISATVAVVGGALAGTQVYQGVQARNAAKDQARAATAAARLQTQAIDRQTQASVKAGQTQRQASQRALNTSVIENQRNLIDVNKAQGRQPNIAAIVANNLYGANGTMLSGSGGVNPSRLSLGKNQAVGG